ncbi:MAG: nucleotidyltransferase substrate binding protein [Simkaniaceae bacterium]|nr:nucleotidyltransferase substrate binding protein [Simkaniaceae bacterium]
MNKDIRWQQRFENLTKALDLLREALEGTRKEPTNHLYQIALIGSFQFTFELSWKTMKDYLVYNGVEVSLPRDVIKQAFHHQLVQDGQVWIDMLEDRNLMAHVYQEQAALSAGSSIRERYAPAIELMYCDFLKKRSI